jgi:predicted alpha/beta hydrolase family esterase
MIRPLFLTVPGLHGSGADHWQRRWERERNDCRGVELGSWDDPVRNTWIGRIDEAVSSSACPVVLVAHSLGCQAVAWWANLMGASGASTVLGALLVAPPAADRPGVDERIARFGKVPRRTLPFVSLIVASEDDPHATLDESRALAHAWGAGHLNIGQAGHINAASGLGSWTPGQWIAELLRDTRTGRLRRIVHEAEGLLASSKEPGLTPARLDVETVRGGRPQPL